MFADTTSAETLGWFSIILLISIPAFAMLACWIGTRWPGEWSDLRAREPWSRRALGVPASLYAEREDPSYVDTLMRVRGHFPAVPPVFRPDPYAELAPIDLPDMAPVYSVSLAQLVASVRYIGPSAAPVHTHHAQAVGTADRERVTVGRHRAPVLVAA